MPLQNDLNEEPKKSFYEGQSQTNFDPFEQAKPSEQAKNSMPYRIAEDNSSKIIRRVLFGGFMMMLGLYFVGFSFINLPDRAVDNATITVTEDGQEVVVSESTEEAIRKAVQQAVDGNEDIPAIVEQALNEAQQAIEQAEQSGAAVNPSFFEELRRGFQDGFNEVQYSEELLDGMGSWMEEMGYTGLTRDDLIELRKQGVTATYTNGLRELGYDLSLEEVVRLRKADVTVRFAAMMQSLGYELTVDDLMRLKRVGVTAYFTSNLHDLGYRDLTLDQLVRLQQVNVSVDDIQRLINAAQGERPSYEEIIRNAISNQ